MTRCHYLWDTDKAKAVLGEGLLGVMDTLFQFLPREASARLHRLLRLRDCPSKSLPAPNPNRKGKFSVIGLSMKSEIRLTEVGEPL